MSPEAARLAFRRPAALHEPFSTDATLQDNRARTQRHLANPMSNISRDSVSKLRQGLSLAALVLACVLMLQASYLAAQAGSLLEEAEQQFRAAGRETEVALVQAQALLASLRGTSETVRRSAVHQMGYYEAIGRRSASALGRLELLISNADDRLERITASLEKTAAGAEQTFVEAALLTSSVREETSQLSGDLQEMLSASTQTAARIDQRLADDRLDEMTAALTRSSQNVERASAHIAEAAGYARDILSPARKGFWRRLLELLIPRPAHREPPAGSTPAR